MLRCFSCKVKVDGNDFCYGCSREVCVECVARYDHMCNGAHGKKRRRRVVKKK